MKKRILPLLFSALLMLTACGGAASGAAYQEISQEKAKEMMDTQEVLILDVREQDEYDGGHIPGAVLLPLGSISEESAARVIPEKDTTVPGLLPQRQPQQKGGQSPGRAGLHRHL